MVLLEMLLQTAVVVEAEVVETPLALK